MLQAPNEGQQGNPEAKKNAENEEEEYEENQENNGMSTIIHLLFLPFESGTQWVNLSKCNLADFKLLTSYKLQT